MAGLRDQVIGLINEANLSDSPEEKLVQVQEIMLKREPPLLPEFIDNVLDFQVSRRITGRRFTAQFAEAVIKQRPQEFLTRCAECVLNLLSDESPGVLKYAIRAAGEAFRKVLHSLCVEWSGVSPMRPRSCEAERNIRNIGWKLSSSRSTRQTRSWFDCW